MLKWHKVYLSQLLLIIILEVYLVTLYHKVPFVYINLATLVKGHPLWKIHFYMVFGHKCVLAVCEHKHPTMIQIYPIHFTDVRINDLWVILSWNCTDTFWGPRNWHHLLVEKPGCWGTWLPGRNIRSWLYDGRVGEVANRMSSGSFRGGHWRYLPIRNDDNRYFAEWIRLCPGLSKNSENGNSCPKPYKAARKGKLTVLETRMDKESSRGIGMRLLALRQNNRNLIFFGFLAQWPWPRSLLEKLPLGRALQWDTLASSPILQTLIINYYTHTHTYLPSPDPSPPSLWTTSLTGGSVASTENGCGTGWLPAGAGLLPLWQSRVSMVYVLFVAEVFFLFSLCTPQGA